MKNILTTLFFLLIILIPYSCKQKSSSAKPVMDPVMAPETILKSYAAFSGYRNVYLKFSDDFISLDTAGKMITESEFLKQIYSGNYLPLRLKSDSLIYFKLYKISHEVDPELIAELKDIGYRQGIASQWEGKMIPAINCKDINGNTYDSETIKNKILVLDFWFIGCTACRQEMPLLNKLVDEYKNRNDILFIALAPDKEEKLKNFAEKNIFKYHIVSDQFLGKTLEINAFPTAVVVNKKGEIVKVLISSDSYKDLVALLKKEAG